MMLTHAATAKPPAHTTLNPTIVPLNGIDLCAPWLANTLLCRNTLGKHLFVRANPLFRHFPSLRCGFRMDYAALASNETTGVEVVCLYDCVFEEHVLCTIASSTTEPTSSLDETLLNTWWC